MSRMVFLILSVLVLIGCDSTGPSFSTDYPIFYLQNISTSGTPVACAFFGNAGDGLAGSGSHLYFIDRDAGYVRADIDLGQPINDVTTTAEGGYAVAVCGGLLYYVSNETYVVHNAVVLPVEGVFIVTKPQSNILYVIGSDGTVAEIETVLWTVSATHTTGISSPSAAAISADGQALFVADAVDSTIKKLSTSSFEILAECLVEGGTADLYAGSGSVIWAAPAQKSELWTINIGTGLHDGTYLLPSYPLSVAVMSNGLYVFAGCPGYGTIVIDTQTGDTERTVADYGTPDDIAILGTGDRSILCVAERFEVYVLQK
jgi:DNA-binding beta-propeller fold protein YncE